MSTVKQRGSSTFDWVVPGWIVLVLFCAIFAAIVIADKYMSEAIENAALSTPRSDRAPDRY